jgi:hypothetical protein
MYRRDRRTTKRWRPREKSVVAVAPAAYRLVGRREVTCRLTVKLRGRTEAPARRRGRTLSFSARGAKQITPHGPLQRLLDGHLWKEHDCSDKTPNTNPETYGYPKPYGLLVTREIRRPGTSTSPRQNLSKKYAVDSEANHDKPDQQANCAIGAHRWSSNGEVEGPHRSARSWRRGRTISQRPRRQPRSVSRTPPTIVRSHGPPMTSPWASERLYDRQRRR